MQPIDVAIEAMNYFGSREGHAEPTPAPSAGQIAEAEQMLGCRLPPSFVQFMIKAGNKIPAVWDLYWIGGPDVSRRNIVIANDLEREHSGSPLPNFLVTFFEDDQGDQYCFDLRRSKGGGEGSLVPAPVMAASDSLPEDEEAIRELAVKKIFHNDVFGDNEEVHAQAVDAREYPIVIWDRTQGMEQLDEALCVVADNFVEWLKTFTHDQL